MQKIDMHLSSYEFNKRRSSADTIIQNNYTVKVRPNIRIFIENTRKKPEYSNEFSVNRSIATSNPISLKQKWKTGKVDNLLKDQLLEVTEGKARFIRKLELNSQQAIKQIVENRINSAMLNLELKGNTKAVPPDSPSNVLIKERMRKREQLENFKDVYNYKNKRAKKQIWAYKVRVGFALSDNLGIRYTTRCYIS